MLLIIVPVMALTVLFAWRYRQGNRAARYEPEWDHSTQLELVIWGAPLLIIICLGALTWLGTHLLDPYRPINRIAKESPVPLHASPLEVDVVALDWKWLFIYPEYGVAAVNEMAVPVDRPIAFKITASSVMNSFYIPALAGQIYAMPGMETQLHAVLNTAGDYEGFSANYSGAGFSGMRFKLHGLDTASFEHWIGDIKASGGMLDRNRYLELEKPSENVPVETFGDIDPAIFNAAVNMCVQPGKMCLSEMSMIDAEGGLGLAGINNVLPLEYDKHARRGTVFGDMATMLAATCDTNGTPVQTDSSTLPLLPMDSEPVTGAGLPVPAGLSLRPEATSTTRPSNS